MLDRNVGTLDRLIRVLIGGALIVGFFMNPEGSFAWLYLFGVVVLVTGMFGVCVLYSLLGINTCGKGRG